MSEHSHPHDHGQTHTHEHGHAHTHEHGHTHDHSHDEPDNYFIDQLCMVGLSGAFGVICLCLWFWQTDMLKNLLAEQFHLYVLLSGFALTAIAFTRGAILWQQSRDPRFKPGCGHDHAHDHSHDHAHAIQEKSPLQLAVQPAPAHTHGPGCGHDHKPGEVCDHDHDHEHHGHAAPHEHHIGKAHVEPDHDEADHDHGWAPWRYVVVLVPIILFLLGLPNTTPSVADQGHERLLGDFISIIYEALPFIVLGVLIAGLLEEFVPQQAIARVVNSTIVMVVLALGFIGFFVIGALTNHMLIYLDLGHMPPVIPWLPVGAVSGVMLIALVVETVRRFFLPSLVSGKVILALGVGSLLGLVFPMCECGIIVVMKRLLRKGLPLSVCVAYMLAGPVINMVVMGSTFVAFSSYDKPGQNDVLGGPWNVVAWRVGLSYLVAIITALVVNWQWQRHGNRLLHPSILHGLNTGAADEEAGNKRSWNERVNNITQTALHDFVDILAFLVLGSLLAAFGKFLIKESNIQDLLQGTPGIAILLMMGIAVLFCLCSEADAFVASNFPLFWPDGSKLAFLVLGPMLDFKLLLMYTRVFRARLIYTIVIALVIQVFAYTTVVDYFFGRVHPPESTGTIASYDLHAHIAGSLGVGQDPLAQLVQFGITYRQSGEGEKVSYKAFSEMADRQDLMVQWKDKVIEVRGEYMPTPGSDQVFNLSRLQITCCRSDVSTIHRTVLARESVTGIRPGQWIQVTGVVDFREKGGRIQPVLIVAKAADIVPCNPAVDPYVK